MSSNGIPMISVVILTKNEEENIGKCLEYLNSQTYKDFETVIVDANSTDKTVNIASFYGAKIIKEDEGKGGYGYARNLGIKSSIGDLIFFLDADVFLKDNRTLEKGLKILSQHEVDGVLFRVCFPKNPLGVYFSKSFGDEPTTNLKEFVPFNGDLLINKGSLFDIGLYDESFSNGREDIDIYQRLYNAGKKVLYWPEIEVRHIPGETLKTLEKKAYRDGYALVQYQRKHEIENNGLLKNPMYPFLASLYAGFYTVLKIGHKGLPVFIWNYKLAKKRRKGYLDGMDEWRKTRWEHE